MCSRCGILKRVGVITACSAALAVGSGTETHNAPPPYLLDHIYRLQIAPHPLQFNPMKDADLQILLASVDAILHQPPTTGASYALPKKYVRGLREIEVLASTA